MPRRIPLVAAVFALILARPMTAFADCAAIERVLAGIAADVRCVVSADLTTADADTMPQDNSRTGL